MVYRIPAPTYDGPKKFPKATEAERKKAEAAANALIAAFEWKDTAEGEPFWNAVHARLSQIAADGVLKDAT